MKKNLSLIAIIFLFASLIVSSVPFASAVTVEIYANAGMDNWSQNQLKTDYPSITAFKGGAALAFNASATGYLSSVSVTLQRVGTITGTISCNLEGVTGSIASDTAVSNGTVYAQSANSIAIEDLPAGYNWQEVTFLFNGTYQITQYKEYTVTFLAADVDPAESTVYVAFNCDMADVATDTMSTHHNNGWIVDDSTSSMGIAIYGSDTSGSPTPTPTPTPATGGSGDADIENLTAIILPWLVPLLICLIPALLGYKFVGELGFFIGLNVGCILAYATLASTAYAFPLWGIILVGVMDVAVVLMRR